MSAPSFAAQLPFGLGFVTKSLTVCGSDLQEMVELVGNCRIGQSLDVVPFLSIMHNRACISAYENDM